MRLSRNIGMILVSKQVFTPLEYAALPRSTDVKKVTFIPPTIGGKGFGVFEVCYRHPKLVPP